MMYLNRGGVSLSTSFTQRMGRVSLPLEMSCTTIFGGRWGGGGMCFVLFLCFFLGGSELDNTRSHSLRERYLPPDGLK